VGDGKYGGQDAFLTGSVSRKMHLHARRLIISEPGRNTTGAKTGGGKLDVTAELPEHFAASMEQLGFDLSLSDASPVRDEAPERTPAQKKQAARQHAKQYRKERRGERKSRTKGTRGGPGAKGGGKSSGGKPRKPSTKGKR